MREIIGNTTATPNPCPNWAQMDSAKADFIKNKPTLGALAAKDEIAKTDLSEDIQEILDKVDSAIQSYEETDPTVPSHIKEITTDDIDNWNSKSEFSGAYEDLTGKPTIPSVDGFATEDYVDNAISTISTPDVSGQIGIHNTATDAHNDIRLLINDLMQRLYMLSERIDAISLIPYDGYLPEGTYVVLDPDVFPGDMSCFPIVDTENYSGDWFRISVNGAWISCRLLDYSGNGYLEAEAGEHGTYRLGQGAILHVTNPIAVDEPVYDYFTGDYLKYIGRDLYTLAPAFTLPTVEGTSNG